MVKSNVRAMPKQRRSRIPQELIDRLKELKRRAEEDRQKAAELDARAERFLRHLREKYSAY